MMECHNTDPDEQAVWIANQAYQEIQTNVEFQRILEDTNELLEQHNNADSTELINALVEKYHSDALTYNETDGETNDTDTTDTTTTSDPTLFESGQVIDANNDYDLAENVLCDVVEYIRSNTIRNEEQFVLLTLAYASGLFEDPNDFVSTVTIGTSSSGKTHLKDRADELYTHLDVFDATTGTDKSLIHDDAWNEADLISMGELNQPPKEMLEFMKRAHGGDEEIVIRQTEGNPATGFEVNPIRKESKSYHFTFAQFDADFEFWNRLLKVPAHESESKNRAVGRMAFGHEDIDLDGDTEYGYPFPSGTERLQAHMLEVKRSAPKRVALPMNDACDLDTWEIIKPIFNHERSESNRIYRMVANLIKASALLNYQHRETTSVPASMDDTESVEAICAEPQDIANVCRCLRTLRATTHEIDARKRSVIEAIRTRGGETNTVEGLEPIVEYLEESDASQVNKPELEAILEDLENDYLVVIDGNEITARNWDALGEPKILEHAEYFEGCIDPIMGDPFVDSWKAYRDDVRTEGTELLGETEIDSEPATERPETNTGVDIGDLNSALESHEQAICMALKREVDGVMIDDPGSVTVETLLGLVGPDEDIAGVDTTGTLLDPNHVVWDVEDKPDSWVSTETDARIKIQVAVEKLVANGLMAFEGEEGVYRITFGMEGKE